MSARGWRLRDRGKRAFRSRRVDGALVAGELDLWNLVPVPDLPLMTRFRSPGRFDAEGTPTGPWQDRLELVCQAEHHSFIKSPAGQLNTDWETGTTPCERKAYSRLAGEVIRLGKTREGRERGHIPREFGPMVPT